MKKEYTKEQQDRILDFYVNQNKGVHIICKLEKTSTNRLRQFLSEKGVLRKRGCYKKYSVNSAYFDIIDTEHKAYWLGIMYSDGCVEEKTDNSKAVRWNCIDGDLMKQFILDINFTGNLTKEVHKKYNKEINCLRINDVQLANSLISLGCIPNKSLTIQFPNIPESLIPHFIRGFFDGDGTVGVYKNSSKANYYTLRSGFCSGSEQFLIDLAKHLPTKSKIVKLQDLDKNVYVLNFSVKDSLALFDYMYKDATIYLNRKYDKFISFKQMRCSTTIIDPPKVEEGIV